MKLLVFGATGRTGHRVVELALERGHQVAVFGRHEEALRPLAAEIHTGDVRDPAAVAAALSPDTVVISALGGGSLAEPGTARSQGTRTIVGAMKKTGARRILVVGNAGVLQADPSHRHYQLPGYAALYRPVALEHERVYEILYDSGLDWTLACPPDLRDGPPTGRFDVRVDYLPEGRGSVSTGDVAMFLLDAAESGRYVGQRVGLNGLR